MHDDISLPRRSVLAMAAAMPASASRAVGAEAAGPFAKTRRAEMHLADMLGADVDRHGDLTAAVQAFVHACLAVGGPVHACLDGLALRIGVVDWSGARDIVVDGGGAMIIPVTQTGGRFVQTGGANVEYRYLHFVQKPGFHYMPALAVTRSSGVRIVENRFEGCGFGARAQDCSNVVFRENRLTEIGIYPRPSAVSVDGPAGFLRAYEQYGTGLKAAACDGVTFVDNVLQNCNPAGGHVSDGSGGAGGFCAYLCNDVLFQGGLADGAPGQGYIATGEWQGTDVVAAMQNHARGGTSFDYDGKKGRNIRFVGCQARRCNQEGITALGCGNVIITGCQTERNRMCSIEAWQCWDVIIDGNNCYEPAQVGKPVDRESVADASSGDGIHVVGVAGAIVKGNIIREARLNGIVCNGSRDVVVDGNIIRDYGSEDLAIGYKSSGIEANVLQGGGGVDEITITNNQFRRRLRTNNAGADIFVGTAASVIRTADNSAAQRPITTGNQDITRGVARYMGSDRLSFGGTLSRPYTQAMTGSAIPGISTRPTVIYTLPLTVDGQANGYELTLSICDDMNGDTLMIERLLVVRTADGAGRHTVIGNVNTNSVTTRHYEVSKGTLLLSFDSGRYTVKIVKVESYISGSRYI